MSALAAGGPLPPPDPGSTRYFVLLYCPRAQRLALATLLAVADEIGAGLERQVDHAVAHARLEWWRQEARRFADGTPQHPWLLAWLRERPADRALELETLIDAAALDLAQARLAGGSDWHLYGASFVLAAQLLTGRAPALGHEQALRELGQHTARREHTAVTLPPPSPSPSPQRAPANSSTHAADTTLPPPLQQRLAPLLVWSSLAERRARRRERQSSPDGARSRPGRLAAVADNLIAWRAARQAQRGRYRSR